MFVISLTLIYFFVYCFIKLYTTYCLLSRFVGSCEDDERNPNCLRANETRFVYRDWKSASGCAHEPSRAQTRPDQSRQEKPRGIGRSVKSGERGDLFPLYGAMHSFMFRANAVLTFGVTVLALLCCLASVSDNLHHAEPSVDLQVGSFPSLSLCRRRLCVLGNAAGQ